MIQTSFERSSNRRFRTCGLDIDSEVDLSAVAPSVDSARTDVAIRLVDASVINAVRADATAFATLDESRSRVQVARSADAYWLSLDDSLDVVVPDGGASMLVHRRGALADSTARLLLGHALSFVLPAHGREALHGAAVELDGRAIVVLGSSGFGKSTLATTLVTRFGARLLADDLTCLRLGDAARVVIEPSSVASWLGGDLPERLGVESALLDRPAKRLARLDSAEAPIPVGLVCFIRKASGAASLNWSGEPDGFVRHFVSHLFNPAVQTRQRFQTHLAVASGLARQAQAAHLSWMPSPEAAVEIAQALIGGLERPAA